MKRYVLHALLLAALLTTGCSSFHEQYLFRSGRPGKANYYRVTITGRTSFTASQFAAGLYDAEAVDTLFGELKGPGKLVSIGGTSFASQNQSDPQAPVEPVTGLTLVASSDSGTKLKPIQSIEGKPIKDQKFVFFLSSNANAIANAIQTYVDSDRIQTAMLSLLVKEDVQKLEAARATERDAVSRANTIAAAMDASVAPLGTGDSATGADVRTAALKALSVLASRSAIASPPSFRTVDEAEQWLRESPGAFRPAGGSR